MEDDPSIIDRKIYHGEPLSVKEQRVVDLLVQMEVPRDTATEKVVRHSFVHDWLWSDESEEYLADRMYAEFWK